MRSSLHPFLFLLLGTLLWYCISPDVTVGGTYVAEESSPIRSIEVGPDSSVKVQVFKSWNGTMAVDTAVRTFNTRLGEDRDGFFLEDIESDIMPSLRTPRIALEWSDQGRRFTISREELWTSLIGPNALRPMKPGRMSFRRSDRVGS
jgi:hypothetical protein